MSRSPVIDALYWIYIFAHYSYELDRPRLLTLNCFKCVSHVYIYPCLLRTYTNDAHIIISWRLFGLDMPMSRFVNLHTSYICHVDVRAC